MLHRRVSVPRPSVRMLVVGPVDSPTGLLLSPRQTRFIKKEGRFPHSHRSQHFPPPHHSRPLLLRLLLLLFHAPAPPLLTLLLLLFRASAQLLLLLLRCLPRPTTPTDTASSRRSVGARGGSPPASPPAMATVTQCRQRRRPHRDTMHVASATIQMFQ
jgi:hypothetical protein